MVSIVYTGPAEPEVEEADTLRLTAVALDAGGNVLTDVAVEWELVALDPEAAPLAVAADGLLTGRFGGTGRVRASAEGLYTNPITVTVLGIADSIAALEPSVVTVDTAATVSVPLAIQLFDIPPGGEPKVLGFRDVRFAVVQPAPGTPEAAQVAIGPSGGEPGDDPLTVTLTTSGSGVAAVTARRVGPAQPDTTIIEAVPLSSTGDALPVAPARFLVLFAAN